MGGGVGAAVAGWGGGDADGGVGLVVNLYILLCVDAPGAPAIVFAA